MRNIDAGGDKRCDGVVLLVKRRRKAAATAATEWSLPVAGFCAFCDANQWEWQTDA